MFDFSRLSYKSRKRWALVVLVVGMPTYVVAVVTAINWLYPDPAQKVSLWVELAIYIGLGLLWTLPFRGLFKGIGQPDPDAPDDEG
ncbi:DUF2842 domain-containing protein [Yoonia sp. R2331]|uniref:DUF2842 domain-containing protein n=1 Tax=Yoonia sp. R2331 TaxID=3237238 RepID=UPI0034E4C6E1